MMISVCIPVYNIDIQLLVDALNKEIEVHQLNVEIIIIDDASDQVFRDTNQNVDANYIQLNENIGRSKIRNRFLNYAKGDFLLFLDCDVQITKSFLQTYIKHILSDNTINVIYGGFQSQTSSPESLRTRYSVSREIQNVDDRIVNPYKLFKTVNFLIKTTTFQKYKFDDKIIGYGYEDYIFAYNLKKHNVSITHINNPVVHNDNSSNEEFLLKNEKAMDTLYQLSLRPEYFEFIEEVTLIRYKKKLENFGLKNIFMLFFKKYETTIRKRLVKKQTSLRWLDIYKLGFLLTKKNA